MITSVLLEKIKHINTLIHCITNISCRWSPEEETFHKMMKLFVVVLLATLAIAKPNSPPCLGCPSEVGDEKGTHDATEALKDALKKLAAGDGPHYSLHIVHKATTQVIQGHLYKLNADLVDENNDIKNCDVEIIDFKEVTVTFKCGKESPLTRKYSH
ncbi:sarcocystatin-A-like [Musca autumnalis]|uniref:sarcocystatin-A-like n=1 Tax=Musca autumnalis TaxID=221902 RepID=UPI003CEF1713